jgi:hypothetical protein
LPKVSSPNNLSNFFIIKSGFIKKYTKKCTFDGVCTSWLCHMFLGKECGIQVLAGQAPSTPTVGSLLKTPCLANPGGKI